MRARREGQEEVVDARQHEYLRLGMLVSVHLPYPRRATVVHGLQHLTCRSCRQSGSTVSLPKERMGSIGQGQRSLLQLRHSHWLVGAAESARGRSRVLTSKLAQRTDWVEGWSRAELQVRHWLTQTRWRAVRKPAMGRR